MQLKRSSRMLQQVSAKAQSAPQSGFWPAYQPPGAQSSSESDSTDEDDVGTTDENDMSADDLKVKRFTVFIKQSSYGSITAQPAHLSAVAMY